MGGRGSGGCQGLALQIAHIAVAARLAPGEAALLPKHLEHLAEQHLVLLFRIEVGLGVDAGGRADHRHRARVDIDGGRHHALEDAAGDVGANGGHARVPEAVWFHANRVRIIR